jgi:hypothetical protein
VLFDGVNSVEKSGLVQHNGLLQIEIKISSTIKLKL